MKLAVSFSLFGVSFVATALLAHAQIADTPRFDVASVKISAKGQPVVGMFVDQGGRLTITNYTLRMLIKDAYGVQDFQIVGDTEWMRRTKFSIQALPLAGSASSNVKPQNRKLPPPQEEVLMLRALLVSRFHLRVHESQKIEQILILQVGPRGANLKVAVDELRFPFAYYGPLPDPGPPDQLQVNGENATITMLASFLSEELQRTVLDQTHLTGHYDFRFEVGRGNTDPSFFSGVERLGLKLMSGKGVSTKLVIDHAELPSDN